MNFTACSNDNGLEVFFFRARAQDVSAFGCTLSNHFGIIMKNGHTLTGKKQTGRTVFCFTGRLPSSRCFKGISRPNDGNVRNQPQAHGLFNRLMGRTIFTDKDAVVGKDKMAANAETACIRCGRCVDVCPGRVVPQMLMTAAEHHDLAAFEKLNGMECCECGSCTFICPAHRPLTQAFKEMRKAVMAERKKKA